MVLEEYEHAKARGAQDLRGGDRLRAVRRRLSHHLAVARRRWRIPQHERRHEARRNQLLSDIDYINAHGTSTQVGDEIELGAVERLLGNAASRVSMSSTKSSTGHLLGAAGAVETIFSILAIRDNVAPPTINLENPSVETAIDLVPQAPRKREINVALSNSFGFGGTNASVILQRVAN